jgi:hypothetical protein
VSRVSHPSGRCSKSAMVVKHKNNGRNFAEATKINLKPEYDGSIECTGIQRRVQRVRSLPRCPHVVEISVIMKGGPFT